MAKQKPINIVVRRGALRRFDALTRKTAELPVEVTWDRRTGQRPPSSDQAGATPAHDRRREPPFTWEVADFVVVDDSQSDGAADVQEPRPSATRPPKRA